MRRTNLIDSPGLFERNHQLVLGLVSGQVRTPQQIADIVIKNTPPEFRCASATWRRSRRG